MAASYQSIVKPAVAVAEMVTVPGPQVAPFTEVVVAAGTAFTAAVGRVGPRQWQRRRELH